VHRKKYVRIIMTFKHNVKMSIAMDFEVVKRRKMIREYELEKQIPNEIIKNAHKARSAGHIQVQEFIIVKDVSIKRN
jgi:hypothetical protein